MQKDDATWLNYGYLAFFALATYVGSRLGGVLPEYFVRLEFEGFDMVAGALSALIAAAAVWKMRREAQMYGYHLASVGELRKVSWPSFENTKRMTFVVLVFVTILSLIMTAFDLIWSKALQMFLV